jgi:hypothetical protein
MVDTGIAGELAALPAPLWGPLDPWIPLAGRVLRVLSLAPPILVGAAPDSGTTTPLAGNYRLRQTTCR